MGGPGLRVKYPSVRGDVSRVSIWVHHCPVFLPPLDAPPCCQVSTGVAAGGRAVPSAGAAGTYIGAKRHVSHSALRVLLISNDSGVSVRRLAVAAPTIFVAFYMVFQLEYKTM